MEHPRIPGLFGDVERENRASTQYRHIAIVQALLDVIYVSRRVLLLDILGSAKSGLIPCPGRGRKAVAYLPTSSIPRCDTAHFNANASRARGRSANADRASDLLLFFLFYSTYSLVSLWSWHFSWPLDRTIGRSVGIFTRIYGMGIQPPCERFFAAAQILQAARSSSNGRVQRR